MWERITEDEWRTKFYDKLQFLSGNDYSFVTGPGRSGAVAAVYASHYLNIPFKPHKAGNYERDHRVLIVDTVEYTGKTLRKASSWYEKRGLLVDVAFALKETRGHYFKLWYETNLKG